MEKKILHVNCISHIRVCFCVALMNKILRPIQSSPTILNRRTNEDTSERRDALGQDDTGGGKEIPPAKATGHLGPRRWRRASIASWRQDDASPALR